MEDITLASQSMASNGDEIVDNVREIGETSKATAEEAETVSKATERQTDSIHEIANESTNLARMAADLQNEVRKFKV